MRVLVATVHAEGRRIMERQEHKECYGTMFPDALHFRENEPISGKVFTYELDRSGGMYAHRSGRKFSAKIEE